MKALLKLALFLASCSPIFGQTSSITATISDSDGTPWVSGTYQITLIPSQAGTPTRIDNGQNVSPTSFSGTMDGTGSFSVTLVSASNINPKGSTWQFRICPNVYGGTCGTTNIAVNASGSYSSQLNAVIAAPRISGGIGTYAYADVEVTGIPNNSYWNVTSLACRYYGSSWGACGVGGGGPPSGAASGVLSGTYPGPGFALAPSFTGLLTATNTGTFVGGQMNLNAQSLVNGCSPTTEYLATQINNYDTEAFTACMTGAAGSTHQITALAGFATTVSSADAVGGYFQARALANNTKSVAFNGVNQDAPGLTGITLSNELDVQFYNAPSAYNQSAAINAVLYNPGGQLGVYPINALNIETGTPGAYFSHGIQVNTGALSSTGVSLYTQALGVASPGTEFNSPIIERNFVGWYDDVGGHAQTADFDTQMYVQGIDNPTYDEFYFFHNCSISCSSMAHHIVANYDTQNIDWGFVRSDNSFSTIRPTGSTGSNNYFQLPAASGIGLINVNNLSDVTSSSTSLSNLGGASVSLANTFTQAQAAPAFFPSILAAGPYVNYFDDFFTASATWNTTIGSPSGDSCTILSANSSAHPGLITLVSGTGGSGTGIVCSVGNGINRPFTGLNAVSPTWSYETDVYVAVLPRTTAGSYQAGLTNSEAASPWTGNDMGFYLSSANSTANDWYCNNNSTLTDSGIGATAAAYVRLDLHNDGTYVHWYINGVEATGCKTALASISSGAMMMSWTSVAGSASSITMDVDYVAFQDPVAR